VADDGRQIILVRSPGVSLFPVSVVGDGGAAGNGTTACSFTYTVTDLQGTEMGAALSPAWARPAIGKMIEATHGTGYWGPGGFVLFQVDELPDRVMRDCPPPEEEE
jgi:hypothetical protein